MNLHLIPIINLIAHPMVLLIVHLTVRLIKIHPKILMILIRQNPIRIRILVIKIQTITIKIMKKMQRKQRTDKIKRKARTKKIKTLMENQTRKMRLRKRPKRREIWEIKFWKTPMKIRKIKKNKMKRLQKIKLTEILFQQKIATEMEKKEAMTKKI